MGGEAIVDVCDLLGVTVFGPSSDVFGARTDYGAPAIASTVWTTTTKIRSLICDVVCDQGAVGEMRVVEGEYTCQRQFRTHSGEEE